jgi:regulator of protease activity HflC (stomatin/prohibitin superfamily)
MDYFLSTIALPLATLLTVIGKILLDRLEARKQRRALKENTDLTKKGIQNAAIAADKANAAAVTAQKTAEETKSALNGRTDELVKAAYEKGLAEGQQQALPPLDELLKAAYEKGIAEGRTKPKENPP